MVTPTHDFHNDNKSKVWRRRASQASQSYKLASLKYLLFIFELRLSHSMFLKPLFDAQCSSTGCTPKKAKKMAMVTPTHDFHNDNKSKVWRGKAT